MASQAKRTVKKDEDQAAVVDAPGAPPVVITTPPPAPGSPGLAWTALTLAILALLMEVVFMAAGDGYWDAPDFFLVPMSALILPIVAGALAFAAFTQRGQGSPADQANTVAMVALVIACVIVATWGLWLVIAMLWLMTWHPSPQPCNFTCQTSGDPTCCNGCGHSHAGGVCPSGSCCGSTDRPATSSGGCCGSPSSSGGSSSGSCCGSSSTSTGGSSSGGGRGAPATGLASVGTGLAGALALRRVQWRDAFAHHPDTPRYRDDVYRMGGMRICIGCATTFPAFIVAAALLAVVSVPGPWWVLLATGLALASMQAISAAGWARRRWAKVCVKVALGAGLALSVVALRLAPWPLALRALAVVGVAVLAWASTIPRRRRMQRDAASLLD
ncbi:MAG: hypothetical protein V4510_13200 [bacterium]